jgi:4-hydroxybenzoate polyprenyltransferase
MTLTQPGRVTSFLRLVKIEHSIFALPFAYLSAFVAMGPDIRWLDLLWITVAMVAGRTFAMAANRILDRKIDAQNPRTRDRELVTGAVSVRTAWTGALVSLFFLFLAAGLLNWLCLVLAPLAVIPLVVYPYAKRFTNYPHYVLALAQAVAPVGAWIAVTGTFAGSGSACGSAASTSSTPARTSRWTGGSGCIPPRRGTGSGPPCTSPPSRTW